MLKSIFPGVAGSPLPTPLLAPHPASDSAAQQALPSVRWVLASLSLSILLPSLGTSIANVGLPTLAQAFNAPFQQVQWVVIAYLLSIILLIVNAGRLGDVMGRRRLLLAGIAVFTAASALSGAAPTLWLLVAARALQGMGAAIMMALTMAFIGDTVPKARTGSAMGLLGTMSAVGTAVGPTLGGVLIASLGWQAIFFVNVPLGVLTFLLAYRYLPADRRAAGAGKAGPARAGMLAMLRDPSLRAGLVMSALVSTVMMATLVVGPFYLSLALGLAAAQVGLVMSAGPVAAALAGMPAGRLVDRFGAQRMTVAGLLAIASGSLALALVPAARGVAGYIIPMVVVTIGFSVFQAANNTAVMASVPADRRGAVSGMLNLSRNLGFVVGASAMGAVFTLASGAVDITAAQPAAVATGMRVTFGVAAALVAIAWAVAWSRRSVAGRRSLAAGAS